MNLIRFELNEYSGEYVLIPRNKIRSIEYRLLVGGNAKKVPVVNGYTLFGHTMEQVLELLDHGA